MHWHDFWHREYELVLRRNLLVLTFLSCLLSVQGQVNYTAGGPFIVGISLACGVGPAGQAAGFDETSTFLSRGLITQIEPRFGSWMDSITTTYGSFVATRRGGMGGAASSAITLNGTAKEKIVEVRGTCGLYVDGFVLITNRGRQLRVGNLGVANAVLQPPSHVPNGYVAAFRGIAKDYLEQIVVVWASDSGQPHIVGSTLKPIGTASNSTARTFDDQALFLKNGPMQAVQAKTGTRLEGLRTTYGRVRAPLRGGKLGILQQAVKIRSGERVTMVEGQGDNLVNRLVLSTNRGQRFVLGRNGTTNVVVNAPSHSYLAAFQGAANTTLQYISFTWASDFPLRYIHSVSSSTAGSGVSGSLYAFDDSNLFVVRGRIKSITAAWSRWLYRLGFSYGGSSSLVHGWAGDADNQSATFTLQATESIVQMRMCGEGGGRGYINGLELVTSTGRTLMFMPVAGCSQPVVAAAPTGRYLAAVKGIASEFVDQLTPVWGSNSGVGALTQPSRWQCLHSIPTPVRLSATGDVECHSVTGVDCYWTTTAGCTPLAANLSAIKQPPVLSCGAYHSMVWGSTGYADGVWHWCPRAAGQLSASAATPSIATPINIAFFILNVCNSGNELTVSALEELIYKDPFGLHHYWGDISFGRAYFTRLTSTIKVVNLPCTVFNQSCQTNAWFDWVEANAARLGVNLDENDFKAYLAPKDICPDIGFAIGRRAYIRTDLLVASQPDLNVLKHELGHLLGLSHSSKPPNDEYGDHSTPMGNCRMCAYSSPHLLQLGWASPVAVLNSITVVGNSYDVPALVDSRVNVIVVQGTWFGDGSTRFFISYRVPKKQDFGMPDEYANKVSVHRVQGESTQPYFLGAVSAGSLSFVDSTAGLRVTFVKAYRQGGVDMASVIIARS